MSGIFWRCNNTFHSYSQQWCLPLLHRCFWNIMAAAELPKFNMPMLFCFIWWRFSCLESVDRMGSVQSLKHSYSKGGAEFLPLGHCLILNQQSNLKVTMSPGGSSQKGFFFSGFCDLGCSWKHGLDRSERASVLSTVKFWYPRKKFVFSPFSLNAKLVGHLYECLAPSEGEVRGVRVCVCEVSTCAWLLVSAIV